MTFIPNSNTRYTGLFEDCVAYWDFKKDAKDLVNSYDGTVSGATLTTNKFNVTDSAYSFDGSSNNITTSTALSFTSNSPMTISTWIYRDSSGVVDPIIEKYSTFPSSQREYVLGFTTSNLYFFGYDETNDGTRGRSAPDVGTGWHHIVGTYNGGTSATDWKIYVDGVQTDTNDVTVGSFTSMINTTTVMGIGNQTPGLGTGYFGGDISTVIMWERELTLAEVKALYDLTKNRYIYPYMKGGAK